MNKIILSLSMIAMAATIVVGGTMAYFSDTATMTGNTFSAGTMDLKIDQNVNSNIQDWVDGFDITTNEFRWANGWTVAEYNQFIALSGMKNLKPGDVREQIIDIKSVGSVNGIATIDLNRTSSPKSDLAGVLNFSIWYDADNNGSFVDTGLSGTVDDYTKAYDLGAITGTDDIASVKIKWSVPTSAGNEIQGDDVTIDAVFGLNQIANQ